MEPIVRICEPMRTISHSNYNMHSSYMPGRKPNPHQQMVRKNISWYIFKKLSLVHKGKVSTNKVRLGQNRKAATLVNKSLTKKKIYQLFGIYSRKTSKFIYVTKNNIFSKICGCMVVFDLKSHKNLNKKGMFGSCFSFC